MGSYRLSREAKNDLYQIYLWGFSNYGEAAADNYYNRLFGRFEELAERPYSYPPVDEIRQGYRRSVCGAHSIYYRITDEYVDIMAILGRQDPEKWL